MIEGSPAEDPRLAARYDAFYERVLADARARGLSAARFPSEDYTQPPGGRAWIGHSRGGGMLWKAPAGVRTLRLDNYEPAATRRRQDRAYQELFARLGVSAIRDVPRHLRPASNREHHTYRKAQQTAVRALLDELTDGPKP